MSHRLWANIAVFAAIVGIASTSGFTADPPADKAAFDRQISDSLRDMHNKAADLFNAVKDYNGSYRMFQGGLHVVRPLLAHRPDVQQLIDQGLQEAERMASLPDRAMRLHKTIEDIRAKLRPPAEVKAGDPKPATPPLNSPPPVANPNPIAPMQTLWQRLGGEERVKKVIDQFVVLVITDPKIDFTRGGKYKIVTKEDEDALKSKLVAYISQVSDGTIPYTGKTMAEAHKGMGVTAEQFDTLAASLRVALKNNQVAEADIDELMKKVEATRADIVGK
jgi:hemoglobin